jgi:hypothetical protein
LRSVRPWDSARTDVQVVWRGVARRSEGEGGLVENDMTGDNDAV